VTTKTVDRLLHVLRSHGVNHFKTHEVEITIGHPPALSDHTTVGPVPSPKSDIKIPATAAAAPPTEMKIPHHINEAARLIKLSDEDLVDELFPEGAPPKRGE
jgi:hypothetical protein